MRHWYRYLDWLLPLPPEAELRVMRAVQAKEEEGKVPFVTFAERYGREQGLEKGLEKGILLGRIQEALETKFGPAGLMLAHRLDDFDLETLKKLFDPLRSASTLEEAARLVP